MARQNAAHSTGCCRSSTKLTMPSLCSASATKPERSVVEGATKRFGSSAPAMAISMPARGLSFCKRSLSASRSVAPARSLFEITRRSASPEVSMTTRAKFGTAPRSRSITSARSANCKSERVTQQTQPLPSNMSSRLAEPAIRPGTFSLARWLAPSEDNSGSKIHLQDIEPADVTIDCVDDGALIDEHVIDLDRAGRRAGRRGRHESADLLRLIGVGDIVGTQAAIE